MAIKVEAKDNVVNIKGDHGVQVAVWKNTSKTTGKPYPTVKVTKRYKKKDSEEWANTDSLNARDFAVLLELAPEVKKACLKIDAKCFDKREE